MIQDHSLEKGDYISSKINIDIKNGFISLEERDFAFDYCMYLSNVKCDIKNEHIKKVNEQSNGYSFLYDISRTKESSYISKFQGDDTVVESCPSFFLEISKRISSCLNINDSHSFVQFIYVGKNGQVRPHYDAAIPGYVTYKCNLQIKGKTIVNVDKTEFQVKDCDLYCFEASLYKHWIRENEEDMVIVSYGFLLPYGETKWTEDSPRVRMSNKIFKFFQGKNG